MQFFLTYPIGPFRVQFLQVTYQKGSSPIKEFTSKNLAHFWRVLLLPRAWVGGYRGSRQKTPNKTSPTVVRLWVTSRADCSDSLSISDWIRKKAITLPIRTLLNWSQVFSILLQRVSTKLFLCFRTHFQLSRPLAAVTAERQSWLLWRGVTTTFPLLLEKPDCC